IRYAKDVAVASLKARIQDMDLIYDRKFDVDAEPKQNAQYRTKLGYESTHSYALEAVPEGARVLELGCGDGRLGQALRERGSYVAGVDFCDLPAGVVLDEFHRHDLNEWPLPVDASRFDYVVMLDVIEHLARPEQFLGELHRATEGNPDLRLIISTGNIAFASTR